MEEESQPADYAVHALADYSNPQMMKVGGLLKQQPITVLIDKGSDNNFLNSKVAARLVLQIKDPCTRSKLQLILQVSHLKWKFKDDDSAQVLPTDTQANEELKTRFPEFMELQP
ncbi:hypothetical protein GW17_00054353 [Ensete ventricosum]|nr:hypothetical protein GW17_00054353 [Ensete ventricosum]